MSYQFKTSEPVPDNVRRIASEEIKFAITRLRGKNPSQKEEDIHEARKSIKRLRALLRLVRPEMGPWFRKENAALRDVGRSLSDLRDSSIVLDTFDSLSDTDAGRGQLQTVRDGLQQDKTEKEESLDIAKTLRDAVESLAAVAKRVPQWPLKSDGFAAIAAGLRGEYRGGRKIMPKALRKNDSLLFHEWRKHAKNQLFHLRLLKDILNDQLRRQVQYLHDLETALGDDHNLLILRQHLAARPEAFGSKKTVRQSLGLVAARENKLRSDAQALGEKIYTQKPKDLLEQLRVEWERAYSSPTPVAKRKTARAPRKVAEPAA